MKLSFSLLLIYFSFSSFSQDEGKNVDTLMIKERSINLELEQKSKFSIDNFELKKRHRDFQQSQEDFENKMDLIIRVDELQDFLQEYKIKQQEFQKTQEEAIEVLQEEAIIAATVVGIDGGFEDNFYDKSRLHGPSQFDSRLEVRQLEPDIDWQWLILRRNQSVGMVVEKERIQHISDDFYQLDISSSLGSKYRLCENVPFRNQPVVGVGSCFVITKNEMATANHVFQKTIDNYAIVFGFELTNKNGIVKTLIKKEDIYYPKEIVNRYEIYDIAIFEIDRPTDRPILKWRNSSSIKRGNEVYMIGHPSGLPKKIAVNASIVDESHNQYFYTSIDSFQGNSGSPVFDFETHDVIGILVSGELDYVYNGTCNEINLCKIPYCKGEKVMRIENILKNY